MSIAFIVTAAITLLSAVAAMSLRNLVHCALLAAVTFAGLAALFLELGAQFVGFSQILVYVGAVAILIVFAILLTRGSEPAGERILSSPAWAGILVAGLVGATLIAAILSTPLGQLAALGKSDLGEAASVKNIGVRLMTEFALPLEVLAVLLTVATIGAVIIALHERRGRP